MRSEGLYSPCRSRFAMARRPTATRTAGPIRRRHPRLFLETAVSPLGLGRSVHAYIQQARRSSCSFDVDLGQESCTKRRRSRSLQRKRFDWSMTTKSSARRRFHAGEPGYEVITAGSGTEAISILEKGRRSSFVHRHNHAGRSAAASSAKGRPKSSRRSKYCLPRATPRNPSFTTAGSTGGGVLARALRS